MSNRTIRSGLMRAGYHLVFWAMVWIFFFYLFGWNSEFKEVSRIVSVGLMPVVMAVSYYMNYWLIPEFLWNKRYVRFALYSFYALLFGIWLSFIIVFYALMYIIKHQDTIDPGALHPELQVLSMNFVVFFAIVVKVLKRSMLLQKEKNRVESRKLQMELKLKEAELELLKNQIHPHFLFNTLNNLYGLTLEKSDHASELVLQLSDMLDYILYRGSKESVLLDEEIKNLENFIQIEKLRHTDYLTCHVEFPRDRKGLKIAPLLLIPFVENAFKHGMQPGKEKVQIDIVLQLDQNKMVFQVNNPLKMVHESSSSGGIGIQNVRKRLELIYPGRYTLDIVESHDSFCVTLTIELEQ